MRNEILYRGFENIPSRKGRGGTYQYVRWQDVADRMNEAFGLFWSSKVVYQDIIGDKIVVRVQVSVYNPETNNTSYQEGFGGAQNDDRSEAGNPFKAAYSKALKDACKRWGLGLFFDEEETETPDKPVFDVDNLTMTQRFKEPTIPVNTPTSAPTPSIPPTPTVAPTTSSKSRNNGLPIPPGVQMTVSSDTTIKQEEFEEPTGFISNNSFPKPPTLPAFNKTMPATVNLSEDEKPMSRARTISSNNGPAGGISDVQKAALHSILSSFKDVDYETLVKEAFEANGIVKAPIPSPDDLTYQEAVFVVKYGNDKFRRR